jgi:hypothetical protein
MATSSLLGIDPDNIPTLHRATGNDSMGPSDASDSGSDSAGVYGTDPDNDTDRHGTGERASVEPGLHRESRDILPDHMEAFPPAAEGDALAADPAMDVSADLYPASDDGEEADSDDDLA